MGGKVKVDWPVYIDIIRINRLSDVARLLFFVIDTCNSNVFASFHIYRINTQLEGYQITQDIRPSSLETTLFIYLEKLYLASLHLNLLPQRLA